jgi:hypothetical protein
MEIATFLVLLTLGVIAFVLLIVGRFISLWFQSFCLRDAHLSFQYHWHEHA